MERLRERLNLATRALATLEEVESLGLPPVAARDIAIMRFIYCFEATWRVAQRFLALVEGVEVGTPKSCMRGARDAGLLSDDQTATALVMVDDRNLTVHTYNEELAKQIVGRLPGYIPILRELVTTMDDRLKST